MRGRVGPVDHCRAAGLAIAFPPEKLAGAENILIRKLISSHRDVENPHVRIRKTRKKPNDGKVIPSWLQPNEGGDSQGILLMIFHKVSVPTHKDPYRISSHICTYVND